MAARKRPGEFDLIERYFRPLAQDPGAFGLADDAALYRQRPDEDLVVTADLVASGVHFFADDPAAAIAQKGLRVNLSDLAAKGAEPFGYLLSIALPENWTEGWIKDFCAGLASDQKTYGVTLLGGDTTRSNGGLTIAITAIGRLPKGQMVLRSGARSGDLIFVTGTIGDGALGLRIRQGQTDAQGQGAKRLLQRYLLPLPRVGLAPLLRQYATSAMDVSDGLIGDLTHICEASSAGAEIDAHEVPLSPAAAAILAAEPGVLSTILNGGDDYEIIATVPEASAPAFSADAEAAGVAVTRIGTIVAGKGPPLVHDFARKVVKVATASHTHF